MSVMPESYPDKTVPENANQECPGTESEQAGKSETCEGCPNQQICATQPKGPDPDMIAISQRLASVKNIILVLSGKGGVGKSTFSTQLAFSLAQQDKEVGLLDIDICGPSVPQMTGLTKEEVHQSNEGWEPIYVSDNLGVMSIGFMLPDQDSAIVWRGPRKNGLIKQFLKDVSWGELDYLVIDTPPGTSDEHISVVQMLKDSCMHKTNAVIVTTPQEVALADVRKEINFCKKVKLNIIGVVENMSYLGVPLVSRDNQVDGQQIDPHHNGLNGINEVYSNGNSNEDGKQQNVASKRNKGVRLISQSTGQDHTEQIFKMIQQLDPMLLKDLIIEADLLPSSTGGAEHMCKITQCKFLGKIPMDQQLTLAGEKGQFIGNMAENNASKSISSLALASIVKQIVLS